jgi:hypothetical protein
VEPRSRLFLAAICLPYQFDSLACSNDKPAGLEVKKEADDASRDQDVQKFVDDLIDTVRKEQQPAGAASIAATVAGPRKDTKRMLIVGLQSTTKIDDQVMTILQSV